MDYENNSNWTLGQNKPNSNPIKANLRKAKMNVNLYVIKDYRKNDDFVVRINKPNSNPISVRPKMSVNLYLIEDYENETAFRPKKTNPKQTQFQTAHLLVNRMKTKLLNFHHKNSLTACLNSVKYLFLYCERDFFMKSFMAKKEQVEQKWLLVDADGVILGRMAAKIAPILMGKNKPTYTPHVDTGDFVIVVNAEKVQLTGKKAQTKEYDYYTHFPGGHKYVSFADMMAKKPEKVVELAIRRMLPKSKLGRKMLKKLKVYKGPEHENQAQKPEKIELI